MQGLECRICYISRCLGAHTASGNPLASHSCPLTLPCRMDSKMRASWTAMQGIRRQTSNSSFSCFVECTRVGTIALEIRPGDRSVAGGAFVVLAPISTRLAHWCRTQTDPCSGRHFGRSLLGGLAGASTWACPALLRHPALQCTDGLRGFYPPLPGAQPL